MPKYIFLTGGVMSGLGKGVTAASIAKLIQLTGLRVTCAKIDPYLNVDAGTMNPLIHGEVFVTADGGETDMDVGTYERFLDSGLAKEHNVTTGQVYSRVVELERSGRYLGQCVQIIPHVTNEIKRRIRDLAAKTGVDVIVIELGGTVGDIEGLPFLEACRQMRFEDGPENTLFVHVTLAPVLEPVGEEKTKPTQHSVQELRRIGIQPDIIVVRSKKPLSKASKNKISLFTSVDPGSVISNPDLPSIYNVPEFLHGEGIVKASFEKLGFETRKVEWGEWKDVVKTLTNWQEDVKIVMVGKYVSLVDSYVSINHALLHGGALYSARPTIDYVNAEGFEEGRVPLETLDGYDGIIIPGGFGRRGSEGKILASDWARAKGIPFLGLCFGFQLSVVSFARHVCNMVGANSTELDPDTRYPVIDLLPEQRGVEEKGATMRLGAHEVRIVEGTMAYKIYGTSLIRERHRHRYEVNPDFREKLQEKGVVFSAFSDDGRRVEALELSNHHHHHPFYLATQYHPEFISRPGRPEPAFRAFIEAALARKLSRK